MKKGKIPVTPSAVQPWRQSQTRWRFWLCERSTEVSRVEPWVDPDKLAPGSIGRTDSSCTHCHWTWTARGSRWPGEIVSESSRAPAKSPSDIREKGGASVLPKMDTLDKKPQLHRNFPSLRNFPPWSLISNLIPICGKSPDFLRPSFSKELHLLSVLEFYSSLLITHSQWLAQQHLLARPRSMPLSRRPPPPLRGPSPVSHFIPDSPSPVLSAVQSLTVP